jgi:hypothetical protein
MSFNVDYETVEGNNTYESDIEDCYDDIEDNNDDKNDAHLDFDDDDESDKYDGDVGLFDKICNERYALITMFLTLTLFNLL